MKFTLGLTLLLGLLSAVGPVSTDIYLPAFSIIDHEFGHTGAAQTTLAAWFIGLSIGQLVQGPLSDRIGRRRPLLYSTLIYALASVGCALAPGLGGFSSFRFLAALGGSASMVIPRALIRDVLDGVPATRQLARLTLVLGVVPILAPALGGVMMLMVGWRALFWAAALYGVICTVLVWRFLPDTLPPERRHVVGLGKMTTRYLLIAREPVFATNAVMGSLCFAALFAYISGSASIYTSYFRLSPPQYGILFGVSACGFIAASQSAAQLTARFGFQRVQRVTSRIIFVAFIITAFAAYLRIGGLACLVVPVFVGQACMGILAPLCAVGALARHRDHAGSASALMGTLQFGLAAAAGATIGLINDGTPRPMTALMVALVLPIVLMDSLRPPTAMEALRDPA